MCARGPGSLEGPVEFMASLTPAGFSNSEETARLFPELFPGGSISGTAD